MLTKRCSYCKAVKDINEFGKLSHTKDGLQYRCKTCVSLYKEATKERMDKWYKEHREQNKDSQALRCIKHRAKKQEIDFDLSLEDISTYTTCPVFGWVLERGIRGQKNSPSVDRVDPTKGYTKDNIQILSSQANLMKQDATPEELLMFADWIYKTYQK
jgi:hypothetical protein